jgi:hypothetical protein
MKHVISVTRDMLDDQGILVAQETESLELDNQVDSPETWTHYMAHGAFADLAALPWAEDDASEPAPAMPPEPESPWGGYQIIR